MKNRFGCTGNLPVPSGDSPDGNGSNGFFIHALSALIRALGRMTRSTEFVCVQNFLTFRDQLCHDALGLAGCKKANPPVQIDPDSAVSDGAKIMEQRSPVDRRSEKEGFATVDDQAYYLQGLTKALDRGSMPSRNSG